MAELDYQEANIDSAIQQCLMMDSQECSNELFVDFVMTTDIRSFMLISTQIVSH